MTKTLLILSCGLLALIGAKLFEPEQPRTPIFNDICSETLPDCTAEILLRKVAKKARVAFA